MDALVYPRERTLGTITLVLGSIAWLLIVVGTLGIELIYLAVGLHRLPVRPIRADFIHQEHRGAPDAAAVLRARFLDCCKKLQIETPPEAYVLAGNGLLNAQFVKCRPEPVALSPICSRCSCRMAAGWAVRPAR